MDEGDRRVKMLKEDVEVVAGIEVDFPAFRQQS